ncbi:hypothetical protein QVD17_38138 [Tagetes erecta]|uniref:Uncharacterized protein n=1 Tax=Tagetes erecta TaxID=13708 RepID=A0AAD8NDA3_TARER|nr:hypothetical protein QVD17_38138 [Tagetes erecta]
MQPNCRVDGGWLGWIWTTLFVSRRTDHAAEATDQAVNINAAEATDQAAEASAESAGTVPFLSTIACDQRLLNGWTGYKLKQLALDATKEYCICKDGSDGSDGSGQLCLAAEETKQLHKEIEQQLKLQVTLWQPVIVQRRIMSEDLHQPRSRA